MAPTIPDLWSDDISVDVLPPVAILRAQEASLARKTKGMLEARVTTRPSTEGNTIHTLDLVAPALRGYTERVLTVSHHNVKVYPAVIAAECFAPGDGWSHSDDSLGPNEREAIDADGFVELVRTVLQSAEVRSTISSLIARINEGKRWAAEGQEADSVSTTEA